MQKFTCLFFLENDELQVIEIKRTDLNENAEISDRYKWLTIDKRTAEVDQLTFSASDSSGEIEERYFEEGYLKFNSETGTFIEKFNSAQHSLLRKPNAQVPEQLRDLIETYIDSSTKAS